METGSYRREPRDCCAMAQVRICLVLGRDFQSPADDRQKENFKGSSGSDLPDGRGESDLGSTAHRALIRHAGMTVEEFLALL